MVVQDRAGRASPPTGLARSGLRCDRRHGGGACLFPAAIRLSPEPDLERYHIRPGSGLCLSPSKLTSCPRCNYTLPRYAMGHLKDNTELVARVRRIAGQVTSVEKALVSDAPCATVLHRSEEHTSELQSLMRISYAVF